MYKVALCGKANSGKNTVSKIIKKQLEKTISNGEWLNTFSLAFADPIKEIIANIFPQANKKCLYGSSKHRSQIIGDSFDKNGQPLTYRQALIDIGSLGRIYNKNIWVNKFDSNLNKQLKKNNYKLIICTDVRFEEEFDYLKANNFNIFKIKRNSITLINDVSETTQDGIPDDKFDAIIDNNKSLNDLKEEVKRIIPLINKS